MLSSMAKSPEDPSFWLPSDFLTNVDDVHIMNRIFPTEFPYEFDSSSGPNSALSSPVEGSTETESSSDEDDFLAGLTRRLAQSSLSQTQKRSVPNFTQEKQPEVKALIHRALFLLLHFSGDIWIS